MHQHTFNGGASFLVGTVWLCVLAEPISETSLSAQTFTLLTTEAKKQHYYKQDKTKTEWTFHLARQ